MQEEYTNVKSVMDSIISQNNIEEKVTISYGSIKRFPEELAVFRKKLGWYYYLSDDRNNGYYKGPYDLNALIQLVTYRFPLDNQITDRISEDFPSSRLDNLEYIYYEPFYSEEAIDLYEAEHPEKKVE